MTRPTACVASMMKCLRACVAILLLTTACDGGSTGPAGVAPTMTASGSVSAIAPAEPPLALRHGGALALAGADTLVVADEDHATLWQLRLPLGPESRAERIAVPGPPAQVLAVRDRLLVSVRDPGLLLVLRAGREQARIAVPADAWGLAVTADASTALVTSAWTHTVTAVDLAKNEVRWSLDVAREPRAVVIRGDGVAYVSHLVGSELTRIDGVGSTTPRASRVTLPPAPSRGARASKPSASLGYAALLSPDESRLYVARHALGALGQRVNGEPTWFGAATVDVLLTAADRPLAPERPGGKGVARLTDYVKEPAHEDEILYAAVQSIDGPEGPLPLTEVAPFVQPRALAYRKSTRTLLVASEGGDEIVELDALALEPAAQRVNRYRLGAGYGSLMRVATKGAAPSGLALASDESLVYVFCRASYDVLAVPLVGERDHGGERDPIAVRLAEDPLLDGVAATDPKRKFREAAALGRRLFYNAVDPGTSGGLGCAGCHPEGRDDGHTWIEVDDSASQARFAADGDPFFVGGRGIVAQHAEKVTSPFDQDKTPIVTGPGHARQTPMLAGRVRGDGPFGWLGESKTLVERITAGFGLHRWGPSFEGETGAAEGRARAVGAFLRAGLVPPPHPVRELDATERRGRELFESRATGCNVCHLKEDEYTNRGTASVRVRGPQDLSDESQLKFKVPSLLYVGGTAPYFHDGSAASLEDLLRNNADRMGTTSQLSPADQAALIAFLRTL